MMGRLLGVRASRMAQPQMMDMDEEEDEKER